MLDMQDRLMCCDLKCTTVGHMSRHVVIGRATVGHEGVKDIFCDQTVMITLRWKLLSGSDTVLYMWDFWLLS